MAFLVYVEQNAAVGCHVLGAQGGEVSPRWSVVQTPASLKQNAPHKGMLHNILHRSVFPSAVQRLYNSEADDLQTVLFQTKQYKESADCPCVAFMFYTLQLDSFWRHCCNTQVYGITRPRYRCLEHHGLSRSTCQICDNYNTCQLGSIFHIRDKTHTWRHIWRERNSTCHSFSAPITVFG